MRTRDNNFIRGVMLIKIYSTFIGQQIYTEGIEPSNYPAELGSNSIYASHFSYATLYLGKLLKLSVSKFLYPSYKDDDDSSLQGVVVRIKYKQYIQNHDCNHLVNTVHVCYACFKILFKMNWS